MSQRTKRFNHFPGKTIINRGLIKPKVLLRKINKLDERSLNKYLNTFEYQNKRCNIIHI